MQNTCASEIQYIVMLDIANAKRDMIFSIVPEKTVSPNSVSMYDF